LSITTKQKKFKFLVVDFDRSLLLAAKSVQEEKIIVESASGRTMEFKNKTSFWGRKKDFPEGELGKWTSFLDIDLGEDWKDNFKIRSETFLDPDVEDPVKQGLLQIDYTIGRLKGLGLADDYRLLIGDGDNFRYDVPSRQPYKEGRPPKPLIFNELRDKFIQKYKSKVVLCTGVEADDYMGMYAHKNQQEYKKTGSYPFLLHFVDKDLLQLWGPYYDPSKSTLEEPVLWVEKDEAARSLAIQFLMGDSTDTILGIGGINEDLVETYGLKKVSSIGETSAKKILEGANTPKEMFSRVVNSYRIVHWDDCMKHLQESFRLLWMLRTKKVDLDVRDVLLNPLGVEYPE